jgi:alpha-beta hydrolase superfamily lysophospholipase
VVTGSELRGEAVDLDPGSGVLVRPIQPNACAAVVVVSDLPGGDFRVGPLTERLAEQDIDLLYIELAHNGPIAYPEVLARVPAACAYLQDRAGRPESRVILVGVGVGGDLVLRAAGTDSNVCGVAAVNPVLDSARTGIELLYTTTVGETIRWGGVRRRLVEALRASERFAQLEHRPALLVFTSNPRPVDDLPTTAGVRVETVASVDEAVKAVEMWVNNTKVDETYVA